VLIKVFVQNEAGSSLKHYHDEKTLVLKSTKTVSRFYPFPYGFILGTTARDGCNVDCYVVTKCPLETGQVVECTPIGLMEQFEGGEEDHNVLASIPGEHAEIDREIQMTLTDFVQNVFRDEPNKRIRAGRFLSASEAETHIKARRDAPWT
jgi:inorganic pyrophosphatase